MPPPQRRLLPFHDMIQQCFGQAVGWSGWSVVEWVPRPVPGRFRLRLRAPFPILVRQQ